jgi:hypothetical protein
MTSRLNTYDLNDRLETVMHKFMYSVAHYLWFAHPWSSADARPIADALKRLGESHRDHIRRLGELLISRRRHIPRGSFPAAFTGLNDLSVQYVVPMAIEDENKIIRLLEAAAAELKLDSEAHTLLTDIIRSEKRHLQTLQAAANHRRAARAHSPIKPPRWPTLRRPTRPAGRGRHVSVAR